MDVFGDGHWEERLGYAVDMMRELSLQDTPESLVEVYSRHMLRLAPLDRFLSVTRRGLEPPHYRIARNSDWDDQPNPWREQDRLPVFSGGLLGELAFSDEPRVIQNLEFDPDDPCSEFLQGMGSLIAIPIYDGGAALNLVVQMREKPDAFNPDVIPQAFWMTNLFSRSTHNLVLSRELQEAHDRLDNEIEVVASIQKTLLPHRLPQVKGLDLSVYYRASHRAGGDYYDIFPLPGDRWGMLLADVSGHGTPAAVLMAITHALSHLYPGTPEDPAGMLEFLSRHLYERYTSKSTAFVTAMYGVYDPATRDFQYALAGHPPPRVKHCDTGTIEVLDKSTRPPLGIFHDQTFTNCHATFRPGDQLVVYTDGVTEAMSKSRELFGAERIDDVLAKCSGDAEDLKDRIINAVQEFTEYAPQTDDTTLLVAKIG